MAYASITAGEANSPTQIVPNTPPTRWTESAPTGSSTLNLSQQRTDSTTRPPATAPMIAAAPTLTTAHGAVIATNPARQPLRIMLKSGLPRTSQATAVAATAPNAAAVLVVTAMWPICVLAVIVDPGLKP